MIFCIGSSQNGIAMWRKLKTYTVHSLILFLISLLVFSAAMPRFCTYLAALCAVEWSCIFLYSQNNNHQFFYRVLCMVGGNVSAFVLQWIAMERVISVSNLGGWEFVLLLLLLIGTIYIVRGLLSKSTQQVPHSSAVAPKIPSMLPERSYDLQRLDGFLESGTPLIGVNAPWGDGKTFMINRLCSMSHVRDRYEIVRINVLAGNEDEIELTLMNEFDQILRRNHIFSLASKQMLKFLDSNDILKQFRWMLIEDTQSVSTTFLRVLGDLEKLDKKVLIIVDDIERLGNETLIRKVFALMESVSSNRVQIVYLFNKSMLTGFDRNYLEKYIPRYMNLTPIRFKSIVCALWDELEMDMTTVACRDVGNLVEFPKINPTILNILELDLIGGSHAFRLDNITVRRVQIFLVEFRDMIDLLDKSDGTAFSGFSEINRELLLKGVFIKHFLHDDFEQIRIATSLVDSFLFQLSEAAKTFLAEFDQHVPDRVPLSYLFDIHRQVKSSEDMKHLMSLILEDDGNYNRLLALSMLGFDYADILRDIQKSEQAAPTAASRAMSHRNLFIMKAEQIGNEAITDIERNRNNERIDRVMWNLVANGSSEWANLDAYIKHFQRTVLSAAREDQQKAWEKFASDAWNGTIYKNNTTQQRLAADKYLPLFQGFRVMSTDAEQWIKLLDFYFQQEKENGISAEMLQNLNYVDMGDRRVYISVLKHFNQCRIIGNLNSEPCMYRFLMLTLRMVFTLGYTKDNLFHSMWYLESEAPDPKELFPTDRWSRATAELVGQFDNMKCILEREKQSTLDLSWFFSDIDTIIQFIDKCKELSQAKRSLRMRTPHIEMEEHIHSRHQDICDMLKEELQAGMDVGKWLDRLRSAYEEGKLDPSEIKELIALVNKRKPGTPPSMIDGPDENYPAKANDSFPADSD